MPSLSRIFAPLFLICVALFGQEGAAQAVRVSGAAEGQGFLFRHDGQCYLVTAAHVTAGKGRAQVRTDQGQEGTATMLHPFWPGFDVDLGAVRRLDAACTTSFDQLRQGGQVSLYGASVTLPVVDHTSLRNLTLDVTQFRYLDFVARFRDPGQAAQKGMSGGFALRDGMPVGMARAAGSDGSVEFVQMGEIAMNVDRYLNRGGMTAATPEPEAPQAGTQEGLPLEIISASPPAIDAAHMVEGVLDGSGAFAYPAGTDAVIVLRNRSESAARTAQRLRIDSEMDAGFSMPAKVKVEFLPTEDLSAVQIFSVGSFPADGRFDTGRKAPRYAALVRITLIGSTGAQPVRIDRIVLD